MNFFETMKTGYKIWGAEIKLSWQKHGAQFLTGGGTTLMMLASALMAKKGSSADVQKAISEANALVDKIQNEQNAISVQTNTTEPVKKQKKTKIKKKYALAKAKTKKIWYVGKHFWKEAAVEVAGAIMVGAGQHMNTVQKTTLATGLAAVSAEFAAYRANVVADQGEAKDHEYMTGKNVSKNQVISENGTVVEESDAAANDDLTINADPSAFKFWCSPETCPSVYSDNLSMTIANLECIERNLARMLRMSAAANSNGIGTLYLNDMRREFGGLTPRKMDHPLGGIFGITLNRNDPESLKKYFYEVDLGFRNDIDFMEGKKVGVWIIFPHDPEPIANKVNRSLISVET